MAFPPSFLEEIRARLNLSSVVGRRVKLTKAGREYKACCPFHNEKSPSFYVNDDKSFFHCFGCGAHGDVIGFTMRIDHLAFPEAVEKLAGEAGLEVPRLTQQERHQAERAKGLGDVVEAACVWFQERLFAPEGKAALVYLRGRGLSDETINRFRLGFAPEGRSNLQSALKAKGFDQKLILEAALITDPQDGREPFDFFRNRVMFPITDRRGRVIAFGGRVMDDSKPKYLNSRDSPLFHKRGNLYALDKARLAIGEKKAQAIVVEGYMDVIALHQAGFGGAVAPLGTALTEEQILALWRVHPEPIVCLDGDAAGQRAVSKAVEVALPLLKPRFSLRFALLPPEHDPDSLIKSSGPNAFNAVLSESSDLSAAIWASLTKDRTLRSPDHLAALEADIKDRTSRIADLTVRRAYESELIFRRLRSLGRASVVQLASSKQFNKKTKNKIELRATMQDFENYLKRGQEVLIMAALNFPDLFVEAAEGLAIFDFTYPELRRLRSNILDWLHETIANDGQIDRTSLHAHLSKMELHESVHEIIVPKSFQYGAYWHAKWARIGSSLDDILLGFEMTKEFLSRCVLVAELADAEQRFHEEASTPNAAVVAMGAKRIRDTNGDEFFDLQDGIKRTQEGEKRAA
jgi:DNA primase